MNVLEAVEARARHQPDAEERAYMEAIAEWQAIVVARGWIDASAITKVVEVSAALREPGVLADLELLTRS